MNEADGIRLRHMLDAAKISPGPKQSIPSIPWAEIVGMRNRLIHGYIDINLILELESVLNRE